MVVMSACETGLGEVHNGSGVYGLRRSLVLAASEIQVMSLWQVSDTATRDLMIAFYKRIRNGEARDEALRNVQNAMLQGGALDSAKTARGIMVEQSASAPASHAHPYYWAAFIESGSWTALRPLNARN